MSSRQLDLGEYWERRLDEHAGLKGVGWLGLGEPFNRWMYAVRAHQFARTVRQVAGADLRRLRVLDVGSGTGFYLAQWRRLGAESVTGSDLTEVAVERLREAHPETEVVQFDLAAERPPLQGPYDAISAMDVLFHIVDEGAYSQALHNLASLLEPGGLLVLSENFLARAPERAHNQVSRTADEIVATFEAVGLEPFAVRPMFCLMNTPLDSSSRLLRGWWRLLARVVSVHDWVGFVLGAALYPVELALVRTIRRGPSTKLIVCRKRQAGTR